MFRVLYGRGTIQRARSTRILMDPKGVHDWRVCTREEKGRFNLEDISRLVDDSFLSQRGWIGNRSS